MTLYVHALLRYQLAKLITLSVKFIMLSVEYYIISSYYIISCNRWVFYLACNGIHHLNRKSVEDEKHVIFYLPSL